MGIIIFMLLACADKTFVTQDMGVSVSPVNPTNSSSKLSGDFFLTGAILKGDKKVDIVEDKYFSPPDFEFDYMADSNPNAGIDLVNIVVDQDGLDECVATGNKHSTLPFYTADVVLFKDGQVTTIGNVQTDECAHVSRVYRSGVYVAEINYYNFSMPVLFNDDFQVNFSDMYRTYENQMRIDAIYINLVPNQAGGMEYTLYSEDLMDLGPNL